MNKQIVFILTLAISARGYVTPWSKNSNTLHPVHGLFVKPSDDGTTGDLYVAATEENGVKTQWLTDQPVNFLPTAAAKPHKPPIPITYASSFASAHDEGTTQKRAVVSPPVQYAYALPNPSSSADGVLTPYSYALPALSPPSSETENTSKTPCSIDPAKANFPQYSPYQFFYPQMMAAYTNAISVLRNAGLSEDTANSVMAQTSLWSPYAYPMYIVMDPSAWTETQTPTSSMPTTKTSSEEIQ
ncbi:hypothetical protein K1T71_004054 [Dendrolimus kikuchii]|uniref:Uncharacterized protein n=1 Tax=Dendrolimus kikuchii TaxID=765133 RepID=A0ACC1D9Z1_9NEOP|nr:hypothetical protein K1T71_004054 [Dendrolimus kikuchii]